MTIRDDDTLVKQSAQQEPHMAVTVDHKQAFVEGLKPTQRQEPVGEVFINTGMGILFAPMKDVRWKDGKMPPEGTKLYTSPPATKPLTDAQFSKLCLRVAPRLHRTADAVELLKAIEAAHGIKEQP